MEPTDLLEYYRRRASEAEAVYAKPERADGLAHMAQDLRRSTEGRDVLEVACGTGYWTEKYASAAASVLATDTLEEVLAYARAKTYDGPVEFARADAFSLLQEPALTRRTFTAAVAAFLWSHILRVDLTRFLESLHGCLTPGARVWVCDNVYVEGNSTPLCHTDADGNTYQRRTLGDGSEHSVLKNYPTDEELRAAISPFGTEIEVERLAYFWILRYRAR